MHQWREFLIERTLCTEKTKGIIALINNLLSLLWQNHVLNSKFKSVKTITSTIKSKFSYFDKVSIKILVIILTGIGKGEGRRVRLLALIGPFTSRDCKFYITVHEYI